MIFAVLVQVSPSLPSSYCSLSTCMYCYYYLHPCLGKRTPKIPVKADTHRSQNRNASDNNKTVRA